MRHVKNKIMKAIFLIIAIFISFSGAFCQSIVTYKYDKQGRLISEHHESVYKIQYMYDEEGNFYNKLVTNYTDITNLKHTTGNERPELYPNPADDLVIIEIPEGYGINNISVFDVTGRKLIEIKEISNRTELNLSNFKSGLYLIKFESEEKTEIVKLIKN